MKNLQHIAKQITIIFFVGILMLGCSQVNAQKIYFSDSTNHWQVVETYTTHINPIYTYYDYWYGRITTINGKDYRLVKSSGGDTLFVREDTLNKMVYYFDQYYYTEKVLYNYNLIAGDTITYFINALGSTVKDSVIHVDTIVINGFNYKHYYLECIDCHQRFFDRNYSVVEGISSVNGPLAPLSLNECTGQGFTSDYFELYCFSNQGLCPNYYIQWPYNCHPIPIFNQSNCFPLSLQNPTNTHNNLKFYPSPFTKTLTLQNTKAGITYNIYNIIGKLISNGITTSNELVIQTKDWNEGTYISELILPNGSRVLRKLVK